MHKTSHRLGTTCVFREARRLISAKPLIEIQETTFYRTYPRPDHNASSNLPMFERLTFRLSGDERSKDFWAIISPSSVSRTSLLQVLAGQHVAIPPTGRKYPGLSENGLTERQAIKYVGFDADRGSTVGGTSVLGAYLSARYESRKEETDFSVRDYLLGNTHLNALESGQRSIDIETLQDVTIKLNLAPLLDMPVSNLSNGQTRRARIAKALMSRPELLLLDGPFMGLDPGTVHHLSSVLQQIASRGRPRLVISLRPEDGVPQWIDHLLVVDERNHILAQGSKDSVLSMTELSVKSIVQHTQGGSQARLSKDGFEQTTTPLPRGEALIDMQGVKVAYSDKIVLGDWEQDVHGERKDGLWWSLYRGQRCGIFGPNGSGKTTMLSLITSDHPQTYSLPIKLFGRSRIPEPGERGITLFELQRRMGHSSPEVHAFFPRRLTVRRTLESAWADAPMAKPSLNESAVATVDAFLQWFAEELQTGTIQPDRSSTTQDPLSWADNLLFGGLSFSSQRLLLFLRTLVARPDLIILDEAFSGMDEPVRDKALLFLSQGQKMAEVSDGAAREASQSIIFEGLSPEQALLVISHAKEDVPGCVREWICLPEPGEGRLPRTGSLDGPLELNPAGWNNIWAR